jgi:hypothetical protein
VVTNHCKMAGHPFRIHELTASLVKVVANSPLARVVCSHSFSFASSCDSTGEDAGIGGNCALRESCATLHAVAQWLVVIAHDARSCDHLGTLLLSSGWSPPSA